MTLPGQAELSTAGKSDHQYARSVARIGIQVADALEYANAQGILHRDVKPSNLLLDLRGTVWVTDFGLAKATDGNNLTHTGDIVGTLRYMAPERFRGRCDARADVYSLGLTLYELLALRPAFDESDRQQLVQQVTQQEPARLRKLNPSVPRDLATIVQKAISPEAEHRYPTAAALSDDLQRFVDDKPIRARHISPLERFWRWGRRNKGTMAAVVLVSLALVIGTTVSVWQAWRATEAMNSQRTTAVGLAKANERLQKEEQATQRELSRAQQAEDKATRELFEALVAGARANRLSRRVGQRYETLETVRKATAMARQLGLPEQRFLELRNEAIAAMALPDLRVANEWPHDANFTVSFDASLERYASADPEGTVEVWRVGEERPLYTMTGITPGELWPQLSPDGGYLAVFEQFRAWLQVWKLSGAQPQRIFNEASPARGSFSPDSRQLALQEPEGCVVVYDLASSAEVRRLSDVPRVSYIAWHPGGARLALAGDGFAQVRALQTGAVLWQKNLRALAWRWLGWHPDGTILAVTDHDAISLFDVERDQQVGSLHCRSGGGMTLAFNPAGTVLASNGWGAMLRLFDPLSGGQIFSTHARMQNEAPQFSADGRFLAASHHDRKLRIWEVTAASEYGTLIDRTSQASRAYGYGNVAVSPDGRWLAAGTAWGITFWNLPTGKKQFFYPQDSPFNFVAFEKGPPSDGVEGSRVAALLHRQKNGLFRLPVIANQEGEAVGIGPAESLDIPGVDAHFAQSRDGSVLVSAQFQGALVRHADQLDKLIKLEGQDDVRNVAVSPDGRWVATSRFSYPGGSKIWKLKGSARDLTYEFIKDLPTNGLRATVFSPDGKRLLAASGHFIPIRCFDVENWIEVPFDEPLEGPNPVFSPDGKLIVVEAGAGVARLVDADSGREYARLEDPNQHRTMGFAFTPDGTTLVCASGDGCCVHLWDLAAIRRQLAQLGLDW